MYKLFHFRDTNVITCDSIKDVALKVDLLTYNIALEGIAWSWYGDYIIVNMTYFNEKDLKIFRIQETSIYIRIYKHIKRHNNINKILI